MRLPLFLAIEGEHGRCQMSHALIISDNIVVSRAIEARLKPMGFGTCDHTWTKAQAIESARKSDPDLVVICDTISSGTAISIASSISSEHRAPILLVTSAECSVYRKQHDIVCVSGPFALPQLETAIALGRQLENAG